MTQSLEPLLVPAFSVAAHVTDPSGAIAGWWTDPPGVVLQFARPTRGTTEMAEWLIGPAFDLLLERYPHETALRVILDMRHMTGRSATARSLLLQRGKTVLGRVGHVVLVPSILLGPAYVKVVEASALVVRAAGLRVDVELSFDRVLARHGVRPARAEAVPAAPALRVDPAATLNSPRDLSRS